MRIVLLLSSVVVLLLSQAPLVFPALQERVASAEYRRHAQS